MQGAWVRWYHTSGEAAALRNLLRPGESERDEFATGRSGRVRVSCATRT